MKSVLATLSISFTPNTRQVSHRKNFRISILGIKREIIGISKGFLWENPKLGKCYQNQSGFLKSDFIPNNGFFESQVLPRNGLFLGQFFPSIGIETSHFISNIGISIGPTFYPRMGFFGPGFPNTDWDWNFPSKSQQV